MNSCNIGILVGFLWFDMHVTFLMFYAITPCFMSVLQEALSQNCCATWKSTPSRSPPFQQQGLTLQLRWGFQSVWCGRHHCFLHISEGKGCFTSCGWRVNWRYWREDMGRWEFLGPLVSGRWIFWLHDLIKARLPSSIDFLDVKLTQPGNSKRSN